MTGDKLLQGIEATRTINDVMIDLAKQENNIDNCKKIRDNLEIITDVLQECFMDMVKMDALVERLKSLNDKLEIHLKG